MTVDRHHWEKAARQYIQDLQTWPPEEQVGWLRGVYVRASESIDRLCQDYRDLCALVLSWPETQRRTLTVEDARALKVCRICRQPPRVPTVLSFGEEFACEECLKGETAMKKGPRPIHEIGKRVWVLVQGTNLVSGQPWYDIRERVVAVDQGGDCLTVVDEATGLVRICPSVDVFLTEEDAEEEARERPKREAAQEVLRKKPLPVCWLCRKPIEGEVYYQAGKEQFPSHRDCLVTIGAQ